MSINKTLEKWNKDCTDKLRDAKEKADSSIEEYFEKFKNNVIPDIPNSFGTFLYDSLGDRVTGQRSSILNKNYFESEEGKSIIEKAKLQNMNVETFLKKVQKENNTIYMRYYKQRQIQLYLTVGRKFGVSYFTGDGNRVHTIYFNKENAFEYILKDHATCIKNKHKRECTEAFIDYRDSFVNEMKKYKNLIVPTPIDIDLGEIYLININNKITTNIGYSYIRNKVNTDKQTYTILENVTKGKVTDTLINVKEYPVWNGVNKIQSYNVKGSKKFPSYISFTFLNVDHEKKQVNILGNVDFNTTEVSHGFKYIIDPNCRKTTSYIQDNDYYTSEVYNRNGGILNKTKYNDYTINQENNILLNLDTVINSNSVKSNLDNVITTYYNMSVKLYNLKQDYADLYFINGNI